MTKSCMRGSDATQESLFTVAKLDDFVPPDHPLRGIALLVNSALGGSNDLFNRSTLIAGVPAWREY